jgi:site-specific DNA-cytosine methylase
VHELSLFSGIGCGIWGTKYLFGWRTVGYVEWDEFCCEVLGARIEEEEE